MISLCLSQNGNNYFWVGTEIMVSRVNTVVLFAPIIRSDSIIDFMELKIFVTDLEHKHQGQIL